MANEFDFQLLCNSSDNSVVVEALGCPGVGKSYVCGNYANEALHNGMHTSYHSIDQYPRGLGFGKLLRGH